MFIDFASTPPRLFPFRVEYSDLGPAARLRNWLSSEIQMPGPSRAIRDGGRKSPPSVPAIPFFQRGADTSASFSTRHRKQNERLRRSVTHPVGVCMWLNLSSFRRSRFEENGFCGRPTQTGGYTAGNSIHLAVPMTCLISSGHFILGGRPRERPRLSVPKAMLVFGVRLVRQLGLQAQLTDQPNAED